MAALRTYSWDTGAKIRRTGGRVLAILNPRRRKKSKVFPDLWHPQRMQRLVRDSFEVARPFPDKKKRDIRETCQSKSTYFAINIHYENYKEVLKAARLIMAADRNTITVSMVRERLFMLQQHPAENVIAAPNCPAPPCRPRKIPIVRRVCLQV